MVWPGLALKFNTSRKPIIKTKTTHLEVNFYLVFVEGLSGDDGDVEEARRFTEGRGKLHESHAHEKKTVSTEK